MAVRVELRIDGRLVDGAEQWWDDIEAALPTDGRFPMLGRVDAYGDEVFARDELRALAVEVRQFSPQAPENVRAFLTKLAELCLQDGPGAELRFLGD